MKGSILTRVSLFVFFIGIILLSTWVSLYDEEHDIIKDGKISSHNTTSQGILTSGILISFLGYIGCLGGFAMSSDFLDFKLKMPKNNLIET